MFPHLSLSTLDSTSGSYLKEVTIKYMFPATILFPEEMATKVEKS